MSKTVGDSSESTLCKLCPNIKVNFKSPEQARQHLQSKKHQRNLLKDQKTRSAKMNINFDESNEIIDNLIQYFSSKGYGELESIETKTYPDGRQFLIFIMSSLDVLAKAIEENPHRLAGKTYAIKSLMPINSSTPETDENRISNLSQHLVPCESLQSQLNVLYQTLSLNTEDFALRQNFIENLQAICRQHRSLKKCVVYTFGSSSNRLGMKGCDLDIVILTNGNVNTVWSGDLPEPKSLLFELKKLLFKQQNKLGVSDIFVVPHARIPVLKFKHLPSQINCDISFNRRLGVLNSRLVGKLMDYDEEAKHLVFALRLWGKQKGFVGGGGVKLNSYTVTLMVIFYLQQIKVLPTINQLKNKSNLVKDKSEGEAIFLDSSDFNQFSNEKKTVESEEMLKGFLEYYVRFSFSDYIISVLTGEKLSTKEYADKFNVAELNVQDPFETSYNTAKGVTKKIICHVRHCLISAALHPNLTVPSHDSKWGVLFLLESTKVELEDKSAKSLVLSVQAKACDDSVQAYRSMCFSICERLRSTYKMVLVSESPHPLLSIPCDQDLLELDMPAKRCKKENSTSDADEEKLTSDLSVAVPLEFYKPYNVILGYPCDMFKSIFVATQGFDLQQYESKVAQYLTSSKPKGQQQTQLTLLFEPADSLFSGVRLTFCDHAENVHIHLSTYLPLACEL